MKSTIQNLFTEFINECTYIKRLRPQTIRGYKQTFAILNKLIPTISVDSLTPTTITCFFKVLNERQRTVGKGTIKEGIKPSTMATYWAKLHTFCEWLVARGYIKHNPCKGMHYGRLMETDISFLHKEEVEKIITAIHLHNNTNAFIYRRNLVLFYLLLFCGLRREEVLSLQIRDIDFERNIVTVRSETSKSKRSRQVPLHSTVVHHLNEYLRVRKGYASPYLFVSAMSDNRLSLDGLKHLVDKIKKHSKVNFHLHQFRHTFAVNFLKSSNNIAKLRQLLGHQDIRVTLLYVRCLPMETMREDIENMSIDNLL